MKTKFFVLALMALPVSLIAQGAQGGASSTTKSTAKTTGGATATATATASTSERVSLDPPKEFSAEGKAKLTAMYSEAKDKDCPPEPIAKRVSEGRAKGASESEILTSATKVKANLEASHDAMVKAGRKPTHAETEKGASAMDRGVTSVQLETMAKHTPSDRSLVVAFDVLSQLSARGTPVTQALAQVQAKIDAKAPDASITGLIGVNVGGGRK